MRNLRKYIAGDMGGITLISNRHAAIIVAAQDPQNGWCPPMGYHMYYLRHIVSNFYKTYKNKEKYYDVYGMGKHLIIHDLCFDL